MSISLRDFSLGDPRIKQSLRKIGSKTPTVGADRGDLPVISCHHISFSNSHALMAGEWNEENWFDLADYAERLTRGFLYRFRPSTERITTLLLCVYRIECISVTIRGKKAKTCASADCLCRSIMPLIDPPPRL